MQPVIQLQSGYPSGGEDRYWPRIDLTIRGDAGPRGWFSLSDIGEAKTSIAMFADFVELSARAGAMIRFPATGTVNDMAFYAQDMGFVPAAGGFRIFNLVQTGGSWNMQIDSSARIVLVASESRLKLEQRPVPLMPELLELQPRTWVDRSERERDPSYSVRDVGLIADEAERVIDMVPAEFREYAEPLIKMWHPPLPPGSTRQPGAPVRTVQYERVWTLFVPIWRQMWLDNQDMKEQVRMLREAVFGPDGKELDG